jgi:integrase
MAGKAHVEARKLSGGQLVYRVRFRHDGRYRAITFDGIDKTAAYDFKDAVEAFGAGHALTLLEQQNPHLAPMERAAPAAPVPTLLAAALAHTESKNTRAAVEHRMKMRRNFERHLDELADLPVDTVTRSDIQQWCDDLVADGYKYKTIKNLRSDISTVYKFLVLAGTVTTNPVLGTSIDADPDDSRDPVFLQHWEFDAIAGFLSGEDRAYIELLAGTGMRKGEALPLRVGDLELAANTIPAVRVHRALKHGHDGNHRIGRTKTKAGMRTVVIDDDLTELIRVHVRGRAPGDLLFPANTATTAPGNATPGCRPSTRPGCPPTGGPASTTCATPTRPGCSPKDCPCSACPNDSDTRRCPPPPTCTGTWTSPATPSWRACSVRPAPGPAARSYTSSEVAPAVGRLLSSLSLMSMSLPRARCA